MGGFSTPRIVVGEAQRPIMYKTGTVIVTVDYGYDIHSISFSGRTWMRIQNGERLTLKGQGFHWDGRPDQDRWSFNARYPGSVDVYTDDGGDIFAGSLEDHEVRVTCRQ